MRRHARMAVAALAAALAIATLAGSSAAGPIAIAVSPDAPRGSGGGSRPVSLERAFEIAREVRTGPDAGESIVIELGAGTYRLDRPIDIDAGLSGAAAAPLVVRGAQPGAARIVGARVLDAHDATATPTGGAGQVPAEAQGHVVHFRLDRSLIDRLGSETPRGLAHPSGRSAIAVSQNGRMLGMARWPNTDFARSDAVQPPDWKGKGPQVSVPRERAERWAGEPELWAGGYWAEDWAFETVPVMAADGQTAALQLAPLGRGYEVARPGLRYFVYNALSELDAPGEFHIDRARGVLTVWPYESDLETHPLELTVLDTLVQIHAATDVRFENLTLELALGDAVRVSDSSRIAFVNCVIGKAGGRGVVIEGGTGNAIEESIVADTGETAVTLAGGDRILLAPAGNRISDSVIVRFGQAARTYRPGVQVDGVGQIVEGNYMAEGPHTAILFTGNDHIIAGNEITRVATETSDSGAIYAGRDWTARGTAIRGNYFHDIGPHEGTGIGGEHAEVKGVYLDDFISGTIVEGNLFVRVMQPMFIGGGRDNAVVGNVFLDSLSAAIHIDDRGRNWASYHVEDVTGGLRTRLAAVPYQGSPYRERYPGLADILDDDPGSPRNNQIGPNVVIGSEPYRMSVDVTVQQRFESMLDEKTVIHSQTAPGYPDGAWSFARIDGLPLGAPFPTSYPDLNKPGALGALIERASGADMSVFQQSTN